MRATGTMQDACGVLKALAEMPRLRIVCALLERNELCVCQCAAMLELSMATVSRHLSVLQEAGLVESRKQERWVYYRLSGELPNPLRRWLRGAVRSAPPQEDAGNRLAPVIACPEQAIAQCRRKRVPRGSGTA